MALTLPVLDSAALTGQLLGPPVRHLHAQEAVGRFQANLLIPDVLTLGTAPLGRWEGEMVRQLALGTAPIKVRPLVVHARAARVISEGSS